MKPLLMLLATAGAAVALTANPAHAEKAAKPADKPGKQAGSLYVFDDGKFFSKDGAEAAKAAFRNAQFDHGLEMTVDTYDAPPADKKAEAAAAKDDKDKWHKFMDRWATEQAKSDKAKGIYVLICRHPGGVDVKYDRQTKDRGFTQADAAKVRDQLIAAFKDARGKPDETARHDRALKAAVEFVTSDLKDTTVKGGATAERPPAPANQSGKQEASRGGGLLGGIGGWICLLLCVGLGAWLVIGLIRALTGGGGGAGPGGPGGGGGFMSSLFGGLFGAMAGMYLYNNLFGGGGGLFGGGGGGPTDAYAGDSTGAAGGDTGAGDWDGGGGAAGGWDDGGGGGDFGGGDFGGGDF